MRMSPESYKYLLNCVGPKISKRNTNFRKAISESERLSLTLHYLAYGGSQQALSFSFRIAKSTISMIVNETCVAIWDCLHEQYMRPPRTKNDWKSIAQDFYDIWNLPHCVGAIDGKHVRIKAPINSGSLYYNYKGFFSLVLMAICDARYVFSFVDIGDYGSNNDSGIFRRSSIGKSFFNKEMNLPEPQRIANSTAYGLTPYYLVGDDAFPLQEWLMKPYPGQGIQESQSIFNYRLSRARRVIENAFGILAARWRVFMCPIQTCAKNAENIVKATLCLHNFLRQTNSAAYCPAGFVDSWDEKGEIKEGEWRRLVADDQNIILRDLPPLRGSRPANSAADVREGLKSYVNSLEGSLSWQWEHVRSRGNVRKDNQ